MTLSKRAKTIIEHVAEVRKATRRAKCAVCRLPEEVRAQLRVGREKNYSRADVLSYLKVVRATVTDLDLTAHYSGHHEEKDQVGA